MARRRKNNLHLKPVIGIYCEGESEKSYFMMLRQKYNASNIHAERVKIEAMAESGERIIDAAWRKGSRLHQDQIYVVFDRDAKTDEELARCHKIAKRKNVKILLSSICFEIWILMHFEKVMRSYTTAQLFRKLSKSAYFGQNYNRFKGSDYQLIYDNVGQAVTNAQLLYKQHDNMIKDDPYTNIHIGLHEIFHPNTY